MSSDFCEKDGQLMSEDAVLPQQASNWKVCEGSGWVSNASVKVKARGGGFDQRNDDGVKVRDIVRITTCKSESTRLDAHMTRFSEGERGQVVGMIDPRTARVKFENRPEEVSVATYLLQALPDDFEASFTMPDLTRSRL